MDKKTFSSWGSAVCVILVIAIMIAFATPFGSFVTNGVKGAMGGFKDAADNALNYDGGSVQPTPPNEEPSTPEQGVITLSGDLPAGVYTLRYVDGNGALSDCADICSLEITDSGEDATYEGLISQNCAPVGATAIGVYNSSNEKVDELSLASLSTPDLGEKLYSFAAISDTHVGANTANKDFQNALTYFENDPDIKFTTICGDLTLSGTDANLASYKSIVETYSTKPVYGIAGNHEASRGYLEQDSLQAYTGQDLYYTFTYENDVYIMLGMWDVHEGNWTSDAALTWLYETLEANRNKRCFVFMHLFPEDGSGDAINKDVAGETLKNRRGEVFYSLLSHYENVTWFHGHSHQEFATQEVNSMNNYDNIYARHSVHISSLAYPKYVSGSSLVDNYNGSEGYIVDVYENYIVLKGRDFITGEFLPIASYVLDTTVKNVEAETYYDPTGTIINVNSNILKSGSTWYEASVEQSTITEINFATSYSGTNPDETWDASVSGNNNVTAYRDGTVLTIVGNENGIIANAASNSLFSGFTNLVQINGLELLNTSHITNMNYMFKDCSKLTSIDLSFFADANPAEMKNVFQNCSLLTSVDLSPLNLAQVRYYSALFSGCTSLTSVNWGNAGASVSSNVGMYMNDLFKECSSLETIDLSIFSGKLVRLSSAFMDCTSLTTAVLKNLKINEASNVFYRCNKLESIDLSGCNFSACDSMTNTFNGCSSLTTLTLPETMNTSKVKTMTATFSGCKLLTLDCSGWDTTSVTDLSNFNKNAPGVVAPVLNTPEAE